jgi:hypothetical protein
MLTLDLQCQHWMARASKGKLRTLDVQCQHWNDVYELFLPNLITVNPEIETPSEAL